MTVSIKKDASLDDIVFKSGSTEVMRISSAGTLSVNSGYGATNTNATATGNITLDFEAYQNFVLTLTGNITLDNPTTESVGQSGFIVLKQDATGGRTVSLGSQFKTSNGAGVALSSGASAVDVVPYLVSGDGEILLGKVQLAFG